MKSEKGITLIALLVIIILICIGILIFKITYSENSSTYVDLDTADIDISDLETDEKKENVDESLILGSWITDNSPHIVYTFYEDGTGTIGGEGMKEMEINYKLKSKKLSVTYTESNSVTETDYSIKDDKLYIGFNIVCSRMD